MHQTDSVYGPFISRRHTRVYNEHFEDYSFSPKIIKPKDSSKLDYLQRRHLSMIESGYQEDIDNFLMRELDEMKSIPLEDDSMDRMYMNRYQNAFKR